MDPFSKALLTTVKDLERRWGLSLVSFLPPEAQKRVESLQEKIKKLAYGNEKPVDPIIEFYEPYHLHCTHLTLKRSNGWGPVKEQDFVKPGHNLFKLFEIINDVTPKIPYINVELDTLKMSRDGLGIILLGKCRDDSSKSYRSLLLETLNKELPKAFKPCTRSWDTDPSKYHELHCRIGFLKRPIDNYDNFTEGVKAMEFEPISFTLTEVTIVHHRYRTLLHPNEGHFPFQLGSSLGGTISEDKFIRKLNLRN